MTVKVNPPFKAHGATDFFHKSYRAIGLEYYKRITMKTPRDTGRAAGNWQIAINSQPGGESGELLPTKGTWSNEQAGKLTPTSVVNFPTITISNALPYIIALEYGSSKQSANGMVRVTMAELNGWAASIGR